MYKQWLIKVVLYFVATVVIISAAYKFIVVDRIYYSVDYTLPDNIDTLVIGASHLQLGFDDRPYENIVNFSQSGMPYFFTYSKSKKLIEENPQIRKLVVSLSPIHISPYGDSNLFSDKGLSREESFKYFPLISEYNSLKNRCFSVDFLLSYLKYKLGVPFNYMEDLKPILISLKRPIKFSDTQFSGKFSPNNAELVEEKYIREKADFYFGDRIYYSNYSINAVHFLAKLTAKHEVDLYILNMPTNQLFKELTPVEYSQKQDKLISELMEKYSHITYINYYDFPLAKDDFYDGDHINIKGVEKLSVAIAKDVVYQ